MDGYRPLHLAVLFHRAKLLKKLLESGADVEAQRENGMNGLLDAARSGQFDLVELLLNHNASIQTRSPSNGWSPLHYALRHEEVVELLVAKGADVNAEDRGGSTSLTIAVQRGLEEVADFLRQKGARATVPSGLRTSLPKFDADVTNSVGMTFRRIEPGKFTMGSPESETGRGSNRATP